jgi:uncharacterized protein YukE
MSLLHMETDLVRGAGYQVQQASTSLQQQTHQLNYSVQNLAGVWQGPSANIFVAEIQPLLFRLNQFAHAGEVLNQRLQREVDEWERVGSSFGGGSVAARVGIITGEDTVTAGPGTVPTVDLPKPHWDFKPKDIIGYDPYAEWPGANQQKLGDAMSDLLKYLGKNDHLVNPPYALTDDLVEKLKVLAAARGLSYDETLSEYGKFVQLMNGKVPDPTSRSDYWGSVQQLRFGKVVGDTLGIDPIFGSLLSPTGGLVGPGDSWMHDGLVKGFGVVNGDEGLLYHGVYHDAAGYLLREHGVGPGYEYLLPGVVDTALDANLSIKMQLLLKMHPELNGQETGIAYWILRMQGENVKATIGGISDMLRGETTSQPSGGGGAW